MTGSLLYVSLFRTFIFGFRANSDKNLPAMQWVGSLSWEVPLEEEMATHSSTLTRKIAWTEESGRLLSPWES